jgi:Kef-type K+ transport system membrane component KefB
MIPFSRREFHHIGRIAVVTPALSIGLGVNLNFFYKNFRKSVIITDSSAEAPLLVLESTLELKEQATRIIAVS